MPAKSSAASPYSVHPGVFTTQVWISSLPEKTGRSLEEWIRLVQKSGPPAERERREWLQKVHGLGTVTCWWIAQRAGGQGEEDSDPQAYLKAAAGYVEDMFRGSKAGLRPILEALIKLGKGLGKDVKICPCKTIVPFYRRHVFAQVKPAARTRIDFGFALGNRKPAGRLLDTGGLAKKDRITHCIRISSLDEIDGEVKRWLQTAYQLDS